LIQLPVAVIRSSNPKPAPDPVVYLNGGPGAYSLDNLSFLPALFKEVLANRDLIVFDQRGVGYASPSLNCPEADDQFYQDLGKNLTQEEAQQHRVQAMHACRERLIKQGVNLAAYTSAANAADVDDLRSALGYANWNLYGVSYGTRLALTVMRDFPDGVRSAILDSAYPPQVDAEAELAGNAERAINLFFERCAADVRCNTAYPNLEDAFYETVARLDTTPLTMTLTRPNTGQSYEAVVNGRRLIVDLFLMLYFTDGLPYVPALIDELHVERGAYMLRNFLNQTAFLDDYISEGMNAAIRCGEEASFTSPQAIATASAAVSPRLRDTLQRRFVFTDLALCAEWGAKPAAAIENQPVVSDIPTLILAGDNDPITPPAWGKLAAQTLSHSYFFEFPWVGHGVLGAGVWGSCSQSMVSAFIADPDSAPDSACLSKLKPFFIKR
jgi:pimeloyl-ACP methyl ester carboxylesterase